MTRSDRVPVGPSSTKQLFLSRGTQINARPSDARRLADHELNHQIDLVRQRVLQHIVGKFHNAALGGNI
jgi:hypothetical protein